MKSKITDRDDSLTAVVTSVVYLTAKQQTEISRLLQKYFKRKIAIENKIDKSILAGFKILVNDWYLDTTLQNDLHNLKNQLL